MFLYNSLNSLFSSLPLSCVEIGLPSSVEADRARVAPAGRSHATANRVEAEVFKMRDE